MLRDFIDVQQMTIKKLRDRLFYLPLIWVTLLAGNIGLGILRTLFLAVSGKNPVLGQGLFFIIEKIFLLLIAAGVLEMTQLAVFGAGIRRIHVDSFPMMIGKCLELGLVFYVLSSLLSYIIPMNGLEDFLVVLFLFFPVIEGISIGKRRPFEAIVHSFSFMKENLLNFGLPSLLSVLLVFFTLREYKNLDHLVQIILLGLVSLFIIYRANLFEVLKDSSRRKREYRRKF